MKEAMFWEVKDKKKKTVQCHLCPRNCVIAEGNYGNCNSRKNIKGKLYSMVYARPCSMAIDPIEKKPLYHFMPGTTIFSIATTGCNLHCKHCQNWEISQSRPDETLTAEVSPEEVVEKAVENGCQSIAYTYTEPTIFYEYVYDIARLARKKGLKNVMVTNGYINKEPLEKLYPFIDAANVDLKAFTEEFYKDIAFATLKPVLETIKRLKKMKVWIEITNLIIPTLNDDLNTIKKMCEWIKNNVGSETPLHFSRFFPFYQLSHLPPTSPETLYKARETALKVGLKHVYIGNIFVEKEDDTYCPKCNELVVSRSGLGVLTNKIKNGKCPNGHSIAGVWG